MTNADRIMTEKEAIHCLKADSEKYAEICEECPMYKQVGNDLCYEDACQIAIQALEKQVTQPIEIFNGQTSCPNCKHLFGPMDVIKKLIVWDMKYCIDCGQKLDWSEEERMKKQVKHGIFNTRRGKDGKRKRM